MTVEKKGDNSESLRVEYQSSQQMHVYYGRIVWQIGSIFIPVALGGFAFGLQSELGKEQFFLLSGFLTALLVFFLISYRRLRWLAHIHMKRCEEIERELGMHQFTLQHQANEKSITIAGKEIKPQYITSLHINSSIPIILIIIIWISATFR